MLRKIIHINEEKCNGCGACVTACHEGAIELINGKAKLIRDDYCDGLGDCLPTCPTNAISFIEREALAYDEIAVLKNMDAKKKFSSTFTCPGTKAKILSPESVNHSSPKTTGSTTSKKSMLTQWPVQIKLAPLTAPYFEGAKLLIAATCSAYAYGDFHERFIKDHITLVGCPKLDQVEYAEKLTEIIKNNNIKSVTLVRMEVPCCGGLENSIITALKKSGKFIPWQVVTLSIEGEILD